MKNQKLLLMPFGLILLVLAIVMDKYVTKNDSIDFIIGLLLGLSVVSNIVYIIVIIINMKRK